MSAVTEIISADTPRRPDPLDRARALIARVVAPFVRPRTENVMPVLPEDPVAEAVSHHAKACELEIPADHLADIIHDVRAQVQAGLSIDEALQANDALGFYADRVLLSRYSELIRINREEAVTSIDADHADLVSRWTDNPHALSDETMAEHFKGPLTDTRFLTTYFDSAQFGLQNQLLVQAIERKSRRQPDFAAFAADCKRSVMRSLHLEGRFRPDNLFFTKNGTHAFRLFCNTFLKPGDTVLATSEEYSEILRMMEARGVRVVTLPPFTDPSAYAETIARELEAGHVDYILTSAVSRRGTVFPLDLFAAARDRARAAGQSTQLIVDACQSFGRVDSDFSVLRPDVLIASSQKGSDFAGPAGMLALSDTFADHSSISSCAVVLSAKRLELANKEAALSAQASSPNADDHEVKIVIRELELAVFRLRVDIGKLELMEKSSFRPEEIDLIAEDMGTLSKTDMARFAFGANPARLGRPMTADGRRLPADMTMPVSERAKTNHALACRFATLVAAINRRHGGRIELLYPAAVYFPDGSVDPSRVSFLFECRVRGLTRAQVQQVAQKYGVTLRHYFDEADPGHSFRVAFHPFMSNDSVKILGAVLAECCAL